MSSDVITVLHTHDRMHMPMRPSFKMIALAALILATTACRGVSSGGSANPPAEEPAPPAPTREDLLNIIGTADDGWSPTLFANLRKGMTQAEVAAHFPGADSKLPFVDVKSDTNGIDHIQFYFAKHEEPGTLPYLRSARIYFAPRLSTDGAFYDLLVEVSAAKYGPYEESDKVRQLLTWAHPTTFRVAQLATHVDYWQSKDPVTYLRLEVAF